MADRSCASAQPTPARDEFAQDANAAVDLHALYRRAAVCGYGDALTFTGSNVQSIQARLRGITAVSAVLIAEVGSTDIDLGAWMRSGLVEAVHAMAVDASWEIDRLNYCQHPSADRLKSEPVAAADRGAAA